jgi:cytosine permease
MSNNDSQTLDDLLEDYATTPVPEGKTVGGVRIGMINGGLAFAVPGLITGIEIGKALGLVQSIYAFLLGGLILSILGTVTGLVGMHNRLTSCMTMKFVFGNIGANVLSFAFVLSLLGWYGVNIDLFSEVTLQLFLNIFDFSPAIWLLEILIGILVTLTTIWGFKLLEKISSMFVPILFLLVVYMLYKSIGYVTPDVKIASNNVSFTFGEAVSAVVGSFIVSVVLMPDFTRFSASKKDTVVASFLPFFLLSTFVYIASAMAGIAVNDDDILHIMLTLGLGGLAFVLLIVSSWVTNVVNLYSSALGLNAINPKWHEWKLIIIAGVLGTVAASFNLLDSFTNFLFSLSVIFTPVAAIYVVDFFIIRKKHSYDVSSLKDIEAVNWVAILSWFVGILVSVMTNKGIITITTIEVCDAILITVPVYYFAMTMKMKSRK